jgi:hypothetical protein
MTAAGSDVADGRHLRPIRIGISACLLSEQVRFDGGRRLDQLPELEQLRLLTLAYKRQKAEFMRSHLRNWLPGLSKVKPWTSDWPSVACTVAGC